MKIEYDKIFDKYAYTNFINDVIDGRSSIDKIDLYVDYWHNEEVKNKSLREFLGMTMEEYQLWVDSEGNLGAIVEAHRQGKNVYDIINNNKFQKYRIYRNIILKTLITVVSITLAMALFYIGYVTIPLIILFTAIAVLIFCFK